MTTGLWDRETFLENLRAIGARAYHDKHPFHVAMNEGGIEAWLRLGEACGLSRDELTQNRLLQPGVRFAVDAYVNFARTQPWPIAIASSLTELFAPDLMAARLAAFEKHYSWIDSRGLDYFRRRVTQARRDSDEALAITLDHCNTPELQREAVRALEFKCDVLWSMLDAIHHAYGDLKEGRSPVRPPRGKFGGWETAAPC